MWIFLFLTIAHGFSWNQWFPVVSISCTDFKNPISIEIHGKEFVLWKKNEEYIIQDNTCPHRATALSERYFDPKGCVTFIPQVNNTKKINILDTYPTSTHADILWVYLGNETISEYPEDLYPLQSYDGTLVRVLPYSFHLLLENLFDPAHIPFTHHKLQSIKDKGEPIIYKQQQYLSESNLTENPLKKYKLPSFYDKATIFYRKWMKNNLHKNPYFKSKNFIYKTRSDVFDRFNQHTDNCLQCKKMLRFTKNMKTYGSFTFFVLFLISNRFEFFILTFLNHKFFKRLSKYFYYRNYIHNEI